MEKLWSDERIRAELVAASESGLPHSDPYLRASQAAIVMIAMRMEYEAARTPAPAPVPDAVLKALHVVAREEHWQRYTSQQAGQAAIVRQWLDSLSVEEGEE